MAEICFETAPGQELAQNGRFPMIPEGDFNSQPRGRQRPEICFQKAPGKDLAQKGHFPRVPEGNFNCRPRGRQMPRNLLPKGSRPGFGPKRAVSQWSQKGILIAGPKAFKRQKFAPKRLHARIWLKPGRFPMIPEEKFNSRPRSRQMAVSQWSRRNFYLPAQRPSNGRNLLPNGSVSQKGLCAKLPAPRDRGSQGANRRFGFKPDFVRGSVPSCLRPRTGVAQAQTEGLDPSRFLSQPGRRPSKKSPPREGGFGGVKTLNP